MSVTDKSTPSDGTPSGYETMKIFLDYILQNYQEEINQKKLDIDGHEVAERLNIDIAEMQEMLDLFARFYIFFRHFFKGDPQEENAKASNIEKESNRQLEKEPLLKEDQSETNNIITIDEKTAGYLSDFCLLFKNKDFTPADLKEKFPALFDLWQQIPILFNVKVSSVAEEFSDKLRKHKAMGKKPKQLTVGDMNFKIEYK